MKKKLAISAKDENVPFPAAVRGSKTPVLKLSISEEPVRSQQGVLAIVQHLKFNSIKHGRKSTDGSVLHS